MKTHRTHIKSFADGGWTCTVSDQGWTFQFENWFKADCFGEAGKYMDELFFHDGSFTQYDRPWFVPAPRRRLVKTVKKYVQAHYDYDLDG